MLIKPADGVRYAKSWKNLKMHVKPDNLGLKVHVIRETRSKDLLVELKCSKEGRGQLNSTLKEVICSRGTVFHLIPRTEVVVTDIEPISEAEDPKML